MEVVEKMIPEFIIPKIKRKMLGQMNLMRLRSLSKILGRRSAINTIEQSEVSDTPEKTRVFVSNKVYETRIDLQSESNEVHYPVGLLPKFFTEKKIPYEYVGFMGNDEIFDIGISWNDLLSSVPAEDWLPMGTGHLHIVSEEEEVSELADIQEANMVDPPMYYVEYIIKRGQNK